MKISVMLFVIVALSVVLNTGCGEDVSVTNPQEYCYNDDRISSSDSAHENWPGLMSRYEVWNMQQSNSRKAWSGMVWLKGWNGMERRGAFIYKYSEDRLLMYEDASYASMSPNGRYVMTAAFYVGYKIYDLESETYTENVKTIVGGGIEWSKNSKYIYYLGMGGLRRSLPNGMEGRIVTDSVFCAKEMDSLTMIGFDDSVNLCEIDIGTGVRKIRKINGLSDNGITFRFDSWDISPDGRYVLVDVFGKKGFIEDREKGGLYLIDLTRNTSEKVLPQQTWGSLYYPKWIDNKSFYASYFCRTKNTQTPMTMIWEYDMKRNTVRQITYPWMRLF